jgi:NAD(P)-dependent dehydrogenase (short-subunit alcohol dehydrogenase family)
VTGSSMDPSMGRGAAGRGAFVTGAASGIGRAITSSLLRDGWRVVATDLRRDALEATAREEGWNTSAALLCTLDVTSKSSWEAAITRAEETFDRIDVGLNVAGVLVPGTTLDLDEHAIDLHLDVNVKGVVLGTQAFAHHMAIRQSAERGAPVGGHRGHIVNIGSLASLSPVPGLPLYCASKFAVRGFTLSAAVELAEIGIAVSLVLPDAVQTPMLDLQMNREEAAITFSGSRALTVDEVARAVIDRVLKKKPLELALPATRGALARVASAAPELAKLLYPMMKKRGLAQQQKARSR